MSKPVVLVLGSSGFVGKATVKSLSESYADKVAIKAATRDPSKLTELAELKGVELVAIDMAAANLADKIKSTGAPTVYIVTPGSDVELAKKASTASKDAGVKNLLVVSALSADLTDTVFGGLFSAIESHVKKLGVPYTLLRLPIFIDNNWGNADSIKGQSTVYGPGNPDAAFTPIAVSDVGKASAVILANPGPYANKTFKLATKSGTHTDLVKAFSQSLGREIKYVQVPYSAAKEAFMKKGVLEWQVNGVLELYKLFDGGSPVTNDPEGATHFKTITGSDPLTVEQWVAAVADGFK